VSDDPGPCVRVPADNPAAIGWCEAKLAPFQMIFLAWTVRLPERRPKVRVVKVIAGFGLLMAGIAMLFVPGPGWLTVAAGLAVLGAEFRWARRALDAMKSAVLAGRERLTRGNEHGHEDR